MDYEFKKLKRDYKSCDLFGSIFKDNIDKCADCNKKIIIESGSSERVCVSCGLSETMGGTVFENNQFYSQEGGRTKHGNYDVTKHCRTWIENIQARKLVPIPESVINTIKECIAKNGIKNLKNIECCQIRNFLGTQKLSKYYKNYSIDTKNNNGDYSPTNNRRRIPADYFKF